MLKKLRTIVYHVHDLEQAKKWYAAVFGLTPYFDEPFYAGFDIGGTELGLDPSPESYTAGQHNVTYWLTEDIRADFRSFAEKKIDIHQDITEVGGGILTGSIFDPFGNVIGLIEIPGE